MLFTKILALPNNSIPVSAFINLMANNFQLWCCDVNIFSKKLSHSSKVIEGIDKMMNTWGRRKSLDLSGPPDLYPQKTSLRFRRWKMFRQKTGLTKTFGLKVKSVKQLKLSPNWIKSCFIQNECLICLKIKFSSPKI